MSIACPECRAWASVKETRTRKTSNTVARRYECANGHRFTTDERVKKDARLASETPGLRHFTPRHLDSPHNHGRHSDP